MKLYLFRHGLAMERDEAFAKKIDDSMRPLTDKGRDKSRRMAKVLREFGDEFEVLVTSPLLRAKQTADIIHDVIGFDQNLECTELVPESPPQAFANWLHAKIMRATSVVAVGHDPQLSTFASWVLGGESESFIDLKKSGVICLEVESFDLVAPRSGLLKWHLSPKMF